MVFSLIFGQKISPSSNFGPRSTFLASKITFSKVWFFSDLSVFWSIFREIRSKSQIFIFKFLKNFYFFRVFYNARAFLTTWMIEWSLQNINRSIRLAAITFRKGPLCPPTVTKNSSETTFWVLLRHNYTSVTPNNFRRQTTFIMKVTSQKSTISEKKSKITKKCQKSWLFKKFWLLWLLTSLHFYTCPTVHEKCPYMRQRKITTKNCIFEDFFRKSHHRTPPTSQKVNEGEIRRKNARKKKVVASQIKSACKKLEKVTGTIRRKSPNLTSWVCNAFTSRRGPYPCLA